MDFSVIAIIIIVTFTESLTAFAQSTEISAIIGEMVRLPCNATPSIKEDSIRLILWYKEGVKGGPIYSFDARNGQLENAKHFAVYDAIAKRAYFDVSTNPAFLILKSVYADDFGEYKCRVDFRRSRTLTTTIKLIVISPPKSVWITDSMGNVLEGRTMVIDEESDAKLICLADNGNPLPSLKWYLNGHLIDGDFSQDLHNRTTSNVLNLYSISRDYNEAVLVCEAMHHMYPFAMNTTLTIDMYLKPLTVAIERSGKSFVAGKTMDLICRSYGSRPPAVLTWIKGKEKLMESRETISENGNKTTSLLSYLPEIDDNGVQIVCRAENIRLKNSYLDDRIYLDVYYAPIVKLVLRTENSVDFVKENDRIYFDCRVNAKPNVTDYIWFRNGQLLTPDYNKEIEINNSRLYVNSVRKEDNANYQCSTRNIIGKGESSAIQLNVYYRPICKENQKFVYGIGLRETARVLCDVDAFPTDLTFFWTINDTKLLLNQKYPVNSRGLRSSLLFTPFTRFDYGLLRCWAENAAGQQIQACLFNVIPAGSPEGVKNCEIHETSVESINIACDAGYDGGLQQIFHLEVFREEINSQTVVYNTTNSISPSFTVKKLQPSTAFVFQVYSSNIKGPSLAKVRLKAQTSSANTSHLEDNGKQRMQSKLVYISGICIMIVAILLLLLLYAKIKLKTRRQQRRRVMRERISDEKISDSKLQNTFANAKSPDIIPVSKQSDLDSSPELTELMFAQRLNADYKNLVEMCDEADIAIKSMDRSSIYCVPRQRTMHTIDFNHSSDDVRT